MSKSQSKIPSPARSLGLITPRRPRTRRTLSAASPARSEMSGKLSSVVEKFVKEDFVLSPLGRRSVLPDGTEIETPRRASWWKRLQDSSRDVLEALDTNTMTDNLLVEEYEFEVVKDKQNRSVPESSDNDSVASIVVPQRRLFNRKKQPQSKFGDIMGSHKFLDKTDIEDQSIEGAPKILFSKGHRNKPIFPAALLNSTNKTINKTVEPELTKQARPNLFGRAGTKRKNIFTDFVISDSEEDSEVQHKVFSFKKNDNKRISLGTRNRRMPSLTPSMTTEIDIDDWNLLPSSTMIGAQEVSRMSTDDIEQVQVENQDKTLVEENASLNRDTNNRSIHKNSTIKDDYDNDKTLSNEDIQTASKSQDLKMNESKNNKTHERSKRKSNVSGKDKTLQNKSSTGANVENAEIIEEVVLEKQQNHAGIKNHIEIMNEQTVEDKMAELHRENIEAESRENILVNRTKSDLENLKETITDGASKADKKLSAEVQDIRNVSKMAENINQDDHVPETEKRKEEFEQSHQRLKSLNQSKKVNDTHQKLVDESEKHESGGDIEPSVDEQENQENSKSENSTNQEEEMENEIEEDIQADEEASQDDKDEHINDISENNKSEEEIEPSAHEEENQDESNEESQENEDEEMDDTSEKHQTEEIESSAHDQESENDTKEESHVDQDENMEEMVWNDNDDENASNTSEAEMDADVEQDDEVASNENSNKIYDSDTTRNRIDIANNRNLTNKSHEIVESSPDNDQIEEEVVEETPNNSTHDTTSQKRKKDTTVKSPEAVLQNMTTDNESFRPIGRSTTFRKSKSVYEMMNRPSLAPVHESTLGSEGSRNSSTEGSEWDSHRTTRKTIRQTLGKEYSTRKSLRALVMQESARRQTELYNRNTSNINKTNNKTVLQGKDKDAAKLHKTKNNTVSNSINTATTAKVVSEDVNNKNASRINKNKTASEDISNKNVSTLNKTKNKTLEDINDQRIRRRTSNRNLSSNQSAITKSPVLGTSSHHVPYHKSLHDIKQSEVPEQMSDPEDTINIPDLENNDSGPEISINASYGQGMSADTNHEVLAEDQTSDLEMGENSGPRNKEVSRRNASVRAKSIRKSDQETLDYEASEIEKSEEVLSESEVEQENLEQEENSLSEKSDCEVEEESEQENQDLQHEIEASEQEQSQQEVEAESDNEESQQEIESEQEESQQENESEHEESQQEIESEQEESQQENESEHEESQQEIESEQEESQQEIESEHEESQQEIESEHEVSQQEVESEHEVSQQEIESDHEDSQQEIESEHEMSQQEIESEQEESRQEIESEHEMSQQEIESEQEESQQEIESEHEESQQEIESAQASENEQNDQSQPESDQESDHEISGEPERDSDDDFVSGLHSRSHKRSVSRVVFDSQMMSVDEVDFEGVSRQTDVTEQSERDPDISRDSSRVSEPSVHEVSAGTQKSMRLMQMEKIAQLNMEIRKKIRDKVQKSLQSARNRNIMSPVPNYSVRRVTKEPRQPKKPKRTGVPMEILPKAFLEDLKYKPPKRFQPSNAPWITKRLYKFLETKLEPKYDYRARVRAEELVQTLHSFTRLARRREVAPPQAVDELKHEMARLRIVTTHHDFYEFFHEFMPREIRIKVNPDLVNGIPVPRNVLGEILQSRTAVD